MDVAVLDEALRMFETLAKSRHETNRIERYVTPINYFSFSPHRERFVRYSPVLVPYPYRFRGWNDPEIQDDRYQRMIRNAFEKQEYNATTSIERTKLSLRRLNLAVLKLVDCFAHFETTGRELKEVLSKQCADRCREYLVRKRQETKCTPKHEYVSSHSYTKDRRHQPTSAAREESDGENDE